MGEGRLPHLPPGDDAASHPYLDLLTFPGILECGDGLGRPVRALESIGVRGDAPLPQRLDLLQAVADQPIGVRKLHGSAHDFSPNWRR
jgi:hypothetical protein